MKKSQIESIKEEIRKRYEFKILKLKKEMDDAINALSKAGITLFDESTSIQTEMPLNETSTTQKTYKNSITFRMQSALDKSDGLFTRKELFQSTILEPGEENISHGSMGVVFAKFVKDGKIKIEKDSIGKQPGVYSRAIENKSELNESSPFNGEV